MRVGVALDCNDEPARVIGAEREFSAIAQRDSYGVDLRVLVSRHRSLSGIEGGLAVC